jgi:DNA-binding beta-propeller fold protein YncE
MRLQSGVIALALFVAFGVGYAATGSVVAAQAGRGQSAAAPAFAVDKMWPKPMPNHWILGSVTGVAVDAQDHIWLVHRGLESLTARTEAGTGTNPPTAEDCCTPAPPVLEFDAAGTLVGHWGGPGQGYEWPVSPGGIDVDAKGNVWITAAGVPDVPITAPRAGGAGAAPGAGRAVTPQIVDEAGNPIGGRAGAAQGGRAGGGAAGGGQRGGRGPAGPPPPPDAHVLKFSRTGQFLLQIGKAGQVGDKASETALDHPADVAVDAAANEVYVADGGAAQRIVVFDATTGAHKRHWGGHGTDFGRVSCVALSKDGMVYVCDRKNDRIQVFKTDGTFVKEAFVSKTTMLAGSVWDIAFSNDAAQKYAFVADGQDEKVFVLDRASLAVAGSFGDGGGWPGTFRMLGSVGVDSKGNLYTGETYEGKRLQKFVKK